MCNSFDRQMQDNRQFAWQMRANGKVSEFSYQIPHIDPTYTSNIITVSGLAIQNIQGSQRLHSHQFLLREQKVWKIKRILIEIHMSKLFEFVPQGLPNMFDMSCYKSKLSSIGLMQTVVAVHLVGWFHERNSHCMHHGILQMTALYYKHSPIFATISNWKFVNWFTDFE